MSETVRTLVESLLMIGAITGAIVWYAVVAGRREGRETLDARQLPRTTVQKRVLPHLDPDAHLGRRGAE
jgi:hypothetical protein